MDKYLKHSDRVTGSQSNRLTRDVQAARGAPECGVRSKKDLRKISGTRCCGAGC